MRCGCCCLSLSLSDLSDMNGLSDMAVLIGPCNRKGSSWTLRLARKKINLAVGRGLVKVSAIWSLEEMNRIDRALAETKSRTK